MSYDNGYVFYDEKGHPFLVYCPKCGKENYSMTVSTGICAWCNYQEPDKDISND